jgi:hypothetical protein
MSEISKLAPAGEPAQTSPEIQFALVLARTINAFKDDPALLRNAVYQQARIALWNDVARNDPEEGARLAQALEKAIVGVEKFAARDDGTIRQNRRASLSETAHSALLPPPTGRAVEPYLSEASRRPLPPTAQAGDRSTHQGMVDITPEDFKAVYKRPSRFPWGTLVVGLSVICAILVGVGFVLKQPRQSLSKVFSRASHPSAEKQAEDLAWTQTTTLRAPVSPDSAAAPRPDSAAGPRPDFPPPTTYGSFALREGQLVELSALEGTVPDKRVAIASPFHTSSRTVLVDGSPTFVVFRRDLASIPADGIEVRVIAKVSRTMKFDSTAKSSPDYAPEEDLWSIRGISYKFKSAPVPGQPEMMIVRPESPDVVLSPGRYALVLKRQGYDFTIAGEVTDPNHCLERTEASNGTFYSACRAR